MSRLKFSNQLFLDNLELQRLGEFIFESGWEEVVRQQAETFGIIKNTTLDNNFNYFRVSQSTPILGNVTLQMQAGTAVAYDQTLNRVRFIKNSFTSPIPFPQDGNWYWIKIAPKYSTLEVGKVSVDISGNLTGVGTFFTEVLRGQPDFPSKITLYKLQSDQLTYNPSTLNALEYDVLEVVDDTNVILQGDFQNETDLYYTVKGTFTPGYTVPSQDAKIFNYDDCEISFVAESIGGSAPIKPTFVLGQEFFIYRIKYSGGNLIIQDYRNELFKVKSDFELEYIDNKKNPLIGVESLQFDSSLTPLDKNLVTVGWGFRSNGYTVNSNLDKLTISAGNGGIYKTANSFVTGDFNGWRLYFDYVRNTTSVDSYSTPEKYLLVKSSVKNGTSIDLFLDRLSLQDFIPITYNSSPTYLNGDKVNSGGTFFILLATSLTGIDPIQAAYTSGTSYSIGNPVSYGDGTYLSLTNSNLGNQPDTHPTNWVKTWQVYTPTVTVVPDVEEISILFNIGSDVPNTILTDNVNRKFTNNIRDGFAELEVIATNDDTTTIPIYNVKYNYKNYKVYSPTWILPSDSIGYLNELNTLVPYTSDIYKAFIKVLKNDDAYSNFKKRVDLGDLQAVLRIPDVEAYFAPLSGRTMELEIGTIKQNVEFTGAFETPLTGDIKINLSITDPILKNGNKFYVYFNTALDNNNIVSGGSKFKIEFYQNETTLLYSLTQDDLTKGQQFFIFTYESSIASGIWQMVHFDKSYNGDGAFQGGSEVVDLATSLQTVSGKNILVVSGYYEVIKISNPSLGATTIDGMRTLNGKSINNLKIISNSVSTLTISNYTTYPSPPTGVVRFAYATHTIANGEYVIYGADSIGILARVISNILPVYTPPPMNFHAVNVPNVTLIGVSGALTAFSPAITYAIPASDQRTYVITVSANFQKNGGGDSSHWDTGIALLVNGSQVTIARKRIEQSTGGVLLTTNQTEFLTLTYIVVLNPGDVLEIRYVTDFNSYDFNDANFRILGFPGNYIT